MICLGRDHTLFDFLQWYCGFMAAPLKSGWLLVFPKLDDLMLGDLMLFLVWSSLVLFVLNGKLLVWIKWAFCSGISQSAIL